MDDPQRAFVDQLERHHLGRPEIVPDGKLHRFDTPEDKPGRKSGWFVFHPDGVPAGAFGSWKSGESHKWSFLGLSALRPEERDEYRRRMAHARWARQDARAAEQEAARRRAEAIWEQARPEKGDHPYLARKRVAAFGIRRLAEALVVPARDADGVLKTLAFIGPDGAKRYLARGQKAGCSHLIGEPASGKRIGLAEGYATAASLHAATGLAVAAAFDAGNLAEAAIALRGNHPEAGIVVFGDDDHENAENPGRRKALAAAATVGGRALFPPGLQAGESDWNDLAQRIGSRALGKLVAGLLGEEGGDEGEGPAGPGPEGDGGYGVELRRCGCFAATNQGIWFLREGRDGAVLRNRLTNFHALITGRTLLDDGLERNEQYEISCQCRGRNSVVAVPAAQFPSLGWAHKLGPGAIVFAGTAVRDRARVAIQSLSLGGTRERHVFVHTGWASYRKRNVFLHAGGAIGPEGPVPGVAVELPEALAGFSFPAIPAGDALRECTRRVVNLLRSGSPSNLFPMVGGAFRSVLGDIDFGIHLTGRTGSGKSELAARIQSFFGRRMDSRKLPGSWSSTGNCNERYSFILKDCVFVVDDFAPEAGTDGAHLHRDAARLFRAIGNHSGRGRLSSDLSIRQARPPRGLVLSTGEDVPKGQSIRARLVLLEMDPPPRKGSAERERVSRVWAQCAEDAANGFFEGCLAGFIRWVAGQFDPVAAQRDGMTREYRNLFLQMGDHLRAPSAFAELAAGFRIFLHFAQEAGAVAGGECADLWGVAWEVFQHGVAAQTDYQRAADPVDKFFDLLSAALGSGRAHLANQKGEMPTDYSPWGWRRDSAGFRPQGERIGWIEGQNIYLEPSVVFDVVQKLAGDERLPVSRDTLWRRIHERGLLASVTPHRGIKVRRMLEGRQREVLHLSAERVAGGGDEKGPTSPTGAANQLIPFEKPVSGAVSGVGFAFGDSRHGAGMPPGWAEAPAGFAAERPDNPVGGCRVPKGVPDSVNQVLFQRDAWRVSEVSAESRPHALADAFPQGGAGEREPPSALPRGGASCASES